MILEQNIKIVKKYDNRFSKDRKRKIVKLGRNFIH